MCGGRTDPGDESSFQSSCYKLTAPDENWVPFSLPDDVDGIFGDSMVPFPGDSAVSSGFWMYGKDSGNEVLSSIYSTRTKTWTVWNPTTDLDFIPTNIVHFQYTRTTKTHIYLAYETNKKQVALCYCSQDASDCQGSQGWECKKSNELGGQELNFDVKTAAAYNGVDGDGQVLIIGDSGMTSLKISGWNDVGPTISMTDFKILADEFPKNPEFAVLDGKLTALGGEDSSGTAVNNVLEFNPDTQDWNPGKFNMHIKRKSHSAAVVPESWLCKDSSTPTSHTTEKDGMALEDQIIIISSVFGGVTVLLGISVCALGYSLYRLKTKARNKAATEVNVEQSGQHNDRIEMRNEAPRPVTNSRESSGDRYGKGWESKGAHGMYGVVHKTDWDKFRGQDTGRYSSVLREDDDRTKDTMHTATTTTSFNSRHPYEDRTPRHRQDSSQNSRHHDEDRVVSPRYRQDVPQNRYSSVNRHSVSSQDVRRTGKY